MKIRRSRSREYFADRITRSLGQLAELYNSTSLFKGLPEEEFVPLIQSLLNGDLVPEVGDTFKFVTVTARFYGNRGWKEI